MHIIEDKLMHELVIKKNIVLLNFKIPDKFIIAHYSTSPTYAVSHDNMLHKQV